MLAGDSYASDHAASSFMPLIPLSYAALLEPQCSPGPRARCTMNCRSGGEDWMVSFEDGFRLTRSHDRKEPRVCALDTNYWPGTLAYDWGL